MNAQSAIVSTEGLLRRSPRHLDKGKENEKENGVRHSLDRAAKAKRKSSNDSTTVRATIANDDYQPTDDDNSHAPPTRRKSRRKSSPDRRSSKKFKDNLSVITKERYDNAFKIGAGDIRNGPADTNEKQALRSGGVFEFRIIMALLAGYLTHICTPVEKELDPQSAEAKLLIKEGKEPQIPLEELEENQLAIFQGFDIEETPAGKETTNVADLATALFIKATKCHSKESTLVRKYLKQHNDFKAASSNTSWRGGTKETLAAAKGKSMRFYKKDCLERGGKKSFFGNGYTLRQYYEREGKWNIEYIRSLGEDDEKEYLLDALLFEEDAETVSELFE